MRILNEDTDKSVENLLILLTPEEAMQLQGYLEQLLSGDIGQDHVHLNDSDFKREITIAIYNSDSYHFFADRVKQLILED
jgi:hypothetical protein